MLDPNSFNKSYQGLLADYKAREGQAVANSQAEQSQAMADYQSGFKNWRPKPLPPGVDPYELFMALSQPGQQQEGPAAQPAQPRQRIQGFRSPSARPTSRPAF